MLAGPLRVVLIVVEDVDDVVVRGADIERVECPDIERVLPVLSANKTAEGAAAGGKGQDAVRVGRGSDFTDLDQGRRILRAGERDDHVAVVVGPHPHIEDETKILQKGRRAPLAKAINRRDFTGRLPAQLGSG